MQFFIILVSLVYAILCIILFFKVWGMCNDVRELKNYFIKSQSSVPIAPPANNEKVEEGIFVVGQTVIYPPVQRIMIVKEITSDGLIACVSYNKGTEEFEGKYKPSQIKHYTE